MRRLNSLVSQVACYTQLCMADMNIFGAKLCDEYGGNASHNVGQRFK